MKKMYQKPSVKKVDYNFQEQIVATSYDIENYADPWKTGYCTWGDGVCSVVFNLSKKSRGIDNCSYAP